MIDLLINIFGGRRAFIGWKKINIDRYWHHYCCRYINLDIWTNGHLRTKFRIACNIILKPLKSFNDITYKMCCRFFISFLKATFSKEVQNSQAIRIYPESLIAYLHKYFSLILHLACKFPLELKTYQSHQYLAFVLQIQLNKCQQFHFARSFPLTALRRKKRANIYVFRVFLTFFPQRHGYCSHLDYLLQVQVV